ncbi:MAG: 2-hydroxyacyl-CoA dehydratase family protein [Methanosarcinales archaeon]
MVHVDTTSGNNRVGITALVPPEIIFACGKQPCDLNNYIPNSKIYPRNKLCAWTAIWREMLLKKYIEVESLIVVAGGDCHNALVDGQKVALTGIPTFFFFYPFDGDTEYLKTQLQKLSAFLGGIKNIKVIKKIKKLKEFGMELDKKRILDKISATTAFKVLISFSDLQGSIENFSNLLKKGYKKEPKATRIDYTSRVALIGVPPIYPDFHEVAQSFGLHIVYDELPYEFLRHSGSGASRSVASEIEELSKSYCNYTFARNIDFRIEFIRKELEKRKVDGIIHYTQFACHHILEDEIFRKEFDYPILTVQGDLPRSTPEQLKLRLEAFSEILRKR